MNIAKTTNKKELNKYNCEKEWALILLRYLNGKGSDYIIKEDYTLIDGWADVDVFAESYSGKFPPLYIQLCIDVKPCDEGYEKIKDTSKSYMFKRFGKTFEAIKCKAIKYTKQRKNFSQITLVIQSRYLIEDDEKYRIPKLCHDCSQYKFKAIYMLSPKGQIYDGRDKRGKEAPELVFQIF
ncbi:MAG: hypothetical protein Q7J06_02930 [Bacteroidales bacterium]|nr:hypothetical protein [Bacteroidales bacterium]